MKTLRWMWLGFLISACSPLAVVDALVPKYGYEATGEVAYGPAPRHRLDVYSPSEAEGAPIVIFFYGGSWQSGDRRDYRFVAQAFASEGFVAVLPDYRVYPDVLFPAFLEDAALATRWVRDNAPRFGGDPERIYLVGHSAGAHVAAMLVFDPRYLAAHDLASNAVKAAVGLAGPYDFLPFRGATLRALFGPEEGWPLTQPINHVDGNEPPVLLLAGARDTTVSPRNTARMAAKIREKGGRVEEIIYPRLGHTGIVGALAAPLRWLAPVLRDSVAFLRANGA